MTLAWIWGLWTAVNAAVFLLYGVDKRRAVRGAWRIPERTLLCGAWLMGGVGAWLGMRAFRHKTKKRIFRFSACAGAALSIAVMAALSAKLTGWL